MDSTKLCPKCNNVVDESIKICPICSVVISKSRASSATRPMPPSTPDSLEVVQIVQTRKPTPQESQKIDENPDIPQIDPFEGRGLKGIRRLKLTLLFLVTGGIATYAIPKILGRTIPEKSFQRLSKSDPCLNKSLCVSIYIAPWCPVCNSTLPSIKRLRDSAKFSSTVGVRIFVGADKNTDKLKVKAREVGENAFIDPDDQYGKALQAESFPTFVVTDHSGKIINRMEGGFNSNNPDIAYLALVDHLGLKNALKVSSPPQTYR